MPASRSFQIHESDTYTSTGTGIIYGTTYVLKSFAIQVTGTGATATAWNVVIEGSLNGTNYTTILSHTEATGNGQILFSSANLYPCVYTRSRVVSLTLGPATNIVVYIAGVQ